MTSKVRMLLIKLVVTFCFLIFVISSSNAAIYKSVDAQGNVAYSDKPSQGAIPINLPALQTYEPAFKATSEFNNPPKTNAIQNSVNYQTLEIVSPLNNESIRQNEGVIVIQCSSTPVLKEGDKFNLLMDNSPVSNPQISPSFVLNNVDRGSHTIQVQIINPQGIVVIQSQLVTFHLLRYHIIAPVATTPAPLPLSNNQIQTLQNLEKPLNLQAPPALPLTNPNTTNQTVNNSKPSPSTNPNTPISKK